MYMNYWLPDYIIIIINIIPCMKLFMDDCLNNSLDLAQSYAPRRTVVRLYLLTHTTC